jgi:aryl-alcohol dehydrogenase-like predicted oxidoreductase
MFQPMDTNNYSRRDFVKVTAAASLAVGTAGAAFAGEKRGEMPYRTLGRTGEKVSCIGVGGFHIGNPSEEEATKIIRTAIDSGINFMDNCWDYHDGDSEVRMGKALKDGYREKVFLMTKIDGRNKKTAAKQIEESLQRLQTDHLDLCQMHEIIRFEDPDVIFAEGGAMEALHEAKKAGKIRYMGFTGHKDPQIHLRCIEIADKHGFTFDTVQMPLNVLDAHFRSFEHHVLPVAVKKHMGILGMKSLASGAVMKTNTVSGIEALQYALNLPTSVVITGMESLENLNQALEAARTFKPMSRSQVNALLSRTAEVAATGKFEKFKTTSNYDGTAHNPKWLG